MDIPPWTYSRLDSFETCPKKFYHLKVLKDHAEAPTVHTEWGKRVHTAMEEYVLHGTPLPEGMTQWTRLMEGIAALPGEKHPEFHMALDAGFSPCGWDDAWTRGIADLLVINGQHGAVLDYKTGKRKPSEQLSLYALYAFAHHKQLRWIETGFVWLKDRKITKGNISRDEIPALWKSFLPRVTRLKQAYDNEDWPARPSGLCRGWCPVKSCPHYKESH